MVISINANFLKRGEFSPAFTMIEMIFVIVILGILSAVAIPRLAASRDDAVLVKGKSQVSSIRSGISLLKSKRMMEGNTTVPQALDAASTAEGQPLFSGGSDGNILEYPIISKSTDGNWMKKTPTVAGLIPYDFYINGIPVQFDYNTTSGSFTCTTTDNNCVSLTQ